MERPFARSLPVLLSREKYPVREVQNIMKKVGKLNRHDTGKASV